MTEGPLRAHRRVVSPLHVLILQTVAEAEREYGSLDLRLEGGTALSAYYLMHRQSEDLDLFGFPGMDARDFRSFLEDFLSRAGLHVVGRGAASRGFHGSCYKILGIFRDFFTTETHYWNLYFSL